MKKIVEKIKKISPKNLFGSLKNIFKRKNKIKNDKVLKQREEERSAVYVISTSIILAGMAIVVAVVFFGVRILQEIETIKYQYDPQNPLSKQSLIYYAKEMGINTSWFKSCLESKKYEEKIQTEKGDAEKAEVRGTPSIFVGQLQNNQTIKGFQIVLPDYSNIEYAVNAIKDQGVESAIESVKDRVYQNAYEDALSYYKSQEGMSEEDAKKQAEEYAKQMKGQISLKEVGVGFFPPLKNGNPQVAIVEFLDFECPYCKNFAQQTLPTVKDNLINKGIAAYYVRMFPLDFHTNAKSAAYAAFCANDKGKFWEMYDRLFGVGE